MGNYIPNSDPSFLTWASNFSAYLLDHQADLPIDETEVMTIGSKVNLFRTNLNDHETAQDNAKSVCKSKDNSRGSAEDEIRKVVRQFQASPTVTDEQRAAMGITVRGDRASAASVATLSRPVGSVDTSKRLLHTIRYRDEASSGKARPAYAIGCEIWMAVTAPGEPAPTNPEVFTCLGLNSASPFVKEFAGTDGGKTAHYLLRWASRDGSKGPWSETLAATIVG